MDNNEKILQELITIRKLLTIFSQDKMEQFNNGIKSKYLTTPQREMMYELFDGTKSLKEIGDIAKTSSEAVRVFASSLEKIGLVEYVEINAKTKYPKKVF